MVFAAPFGGAAAFAGQGYRPVLVVVDRVGERRVEREDAVEPGNPEDGHDLAVGDHELERSILLTQALEAAHQGAQAGGVQEIDLAEVGDDVPGAVGEKLEDLSAVVMKMSFSMVLSGSNGKIDIGSSSLFIEMVTRLNTSSERSCWNFG